MAEPVAWVTVNRAVRTVPPCAVITTGVSLSTPKVATLNVVETCPAGTMTLTGALAAALSLNSQMTVPFAGAGPEIVAVPVTGLPAVAVEVARAMAISEGGTTVSGAVSVTPAVALSITGVGPPTDPVVILKLIEVAFAGTVTITGTETELSLLERPTTCPPGGAGLIKTTVPVGVIPPVTADRDR